MSGDKKPTAVKVPGTAFYRAAVITNAAQEQRHTTLLPLAPCGSRHLAVRAAQIYLQSADVVEFQK